MTEQFTFAKATKDQAKARIALAGPSGSGKTFTSLLIAQALGKSVAVIDTERGSASKYADEFDFETLQMFKYDPRDLIKALAAAAAGGFEVAIVDSLSHFWMGSEGMLEQVDHAAKRSAGGNSFGGWKEARPMERDMVDALLAYPGHVIVTMRTKTEWVVEENDRGRKVPRKIGTKPEQREGIEYEFDIVGDMDLENTLVVSKTRCRALAGAVIRRPDGDNFGATVLTWLGTGAPSKTAADYLAVALDPSQSAAALRELYKTVMHHNLGSAAVQDETGQTVKLAELIIAKGHAAQAEAQRKATEAVTPPAEEQHVLDAITDKQRGRIMASLGNGSHEQRVEYLSNVVGRPVESTNDLTKDEAGRVIDRLEQGGAVAEPVSS